jgi:hypothetical protein
MLLVAAGLSLDLYVVARKVLHERGGAIIAAAASATIFLALWFGLPLAVRAGAGRHRQPARPRPASAER